MEAPSTVTLEEMKMKKMIALLIVLALMSVLFVGCKSGDESTPATENAGASEPVSTEGVAGSEDTQAATEPTETTTDVVTGETEATAPATEPTQSTVSPTTGVEVEVEGNGGTADENTMIDFDDLLSAAG